MTKLKTLLIFVYTTIIFLILLYCTSPSVNSGDSGEFITTAVTLGIAHSPGYPFYSLLGKFVSVLLPFGNPAYKINVFNVLLTLGLFVFIILWSIKNYKNDLKIWCCILLISVLIFSESFFRNTVQTEVFVLNSLSAVVILFLLYESLKYKNLHFLFFTSFIFGLSLGNHHTIIFLFPAFIYLFFKNKVSFKNIILLVLFFVLGFSIYFMLPIRAKKQPYFNWGNPENIYNLYRVVTRKDYGTFQLTVEKPLEYNIKNLLLQLKRFLLHTVKDLSIIVFVLGIVAFYIIYKHNKKVFLILFFSYLFSGIGFFALSNLHFGPLYDGILERFYILPNTIFVVTIIISLTYITKYMTFILILLLCSVVINIYKNFERCNYRNYYLNYDYGSNIMRSLLKNSVLFMDGGDDTFYTLGYLQAVEKKRVDVELHDRGGLVFKNIYGEDFRKLTKQEKENRRIAVEQSYLLTKPVFYSTFNKNVLPNYNLLYAGAVYVVDTPFIPNWYKEKDLFKQLYSFRSICQKYYDYRSNALAPVYYFMEATNETDDYKKFLLLKYTYYLWPEVDWLINNIKFELHNMGYQMFNEQKYEFCKNIYNFLLTIDKTDINALLNLGVTYEKLNNFDLAESCYNKVLELDRNNPTAYYNLGVLYWNKNDWDKVIYYFNRVLELQPSNQTVKNYIYRAMIEKNKTK
jgi:tetratricopeptide (TPR) repeat protein